MYGGNAINICESNKRNRPTHTWLIGKNPVAIKKENIKIILSYMKNEGDFIVKLQKIHKDYRRKMLNDIENEVKWSKKMDGRTNFINFVCNFTCNDRIERYNDDDFKEIPFCDGNDEISVMIIEYIEGNTLDKTRNNLLHKLNDEQLKSFILRCYYAIIQTFFDIDFLHNDLNMVNIMIRKTNDEIQSYKINDKHYNINTYGYEPIFIDFGRSDKGINNINNLMDEINILNKSIIGSLVLNDSSSKIYVPIGNKIDTKIKYDIFIQMLEDW